MSENHSIFIDSNIWLYSFFISDPAKQEKAKELVTKNGIVCSAQVVNEVCYNLRRKAQFAETRIQPLIDSFYKRCRFINLDRELLKRGSQLRERHTFSFWDSLIVAAAFLGECSTLYSEDMHHEQLIEEKLRIVKPFI